MKHALVLLVALTASLALAANPPDTMNYQGVLRNASDAPLTGNYDIVFRFFDAATGGNEIALERHTASSPLGQVAVSGGLFSVTLGSRIEDGVGGRDLRLAVADVRQLQRRLARDCRSGARPSLPA